MGISTHVLDTARGRPAADVNVSLSQLRAQTWVTIGEGITNADGRCSTLLGTAALQSGQYSIHFDTGSWFEAQGLTGLYPEIAITFHVGDPSQNFHIPLLLTANGYTTYRGS